MAKAECSCTIELGVPHEFMYLLPLLDAMSVVVEVDVKNGIVILKGSTGVYSNWTD